MECAAAPGVVAVVGTTPGQLNLVSTFTGIATTVAIPPNYPITFAADGAGRWSVSNGSSVYFSGTTTDPTATGTLGCGFIHAIAGSSAGPGAVSTESGRILVFNAASGQVTQSIPTFVASWKPSDMAFSADGTLLVALGAPETHYAMNVYSLPSASLLQSQTGIYGFGLAQGGSRIGTTAVTNGSYARHVTSVDGSMDIHDDTGSTPAPVLSPSGTFYALSDVNRSSPSSTYIYRDSNFVKVVPGYAVGWLDDDRLFVQTSVPGGVFNATYSASTIYDNQGNAGPSPAFPEIFAFPTISSSRIFSNTDANIYDATSGSLVWSSGFPPSTVLRAVVAGGYILYAGGSEVFGVALPP